MLDTKKLPSVCLTTVDAFDVPEELLAECRLLFADVACCPANAAKEAEAANAGDATVPVSNV